MQLRPRRHCTSGFAMPSRVSDYEVLETIGTGTFGKCQKIRRVADGKMLVWKQLDYGGMTEKEKQMLVSEVNLLRGFCHRNIVRYYDRIIDRATSTLYIVTEYCQGGDLLQLIRRCRQTRTLVEEAFVWSVLGQLLSALKECHCRKDGAVMHRDLKPANVFLDDKQNIKLGDFGLARVLSNSTSYAQTFVGTPYYMSPEQIHHCAYNEKSDVWSLGCLVYELAALRPPFEAPNQTVLSHKIRAGKFRGIPHSYSSRLDQLIRSMLRVDPEQRPSLDDMLREPKVKEHACGAPRKENTAPCATDDGPVRRATETANPKADVRRPGQVRASADPVRPATAPQQPVRPAPQQPVRPGDGARGVAAESLRAWEARLTAREAELQQREARLRVREAACDRRERVLSTMDPNRLADAVQLYPTPEVPCARVERHRYRRQHALLS
eukprot:m.503086 g.503086  ORF g.503086 m.503086 type:complete len:438 (+) comp69980_c0_seq1:1-1314(+)